MGQPWARTTEQTKHLNDRFDDYLKARQNGTVEAFRAKLYESWANLWPERTVLFPSWKEADPPLTKDQMTTLGKAISKQKKQLYDYVHWHSLGKSVRTKNASSLLSRYVRQFQKANRKGRKKPTRKRTILEVYSDLYYEGKLQPMVKEALENDPSYASLTPKKRSGRQMTLYRKIQAESWVTESDSVKAEVQSVYNREHQKKKRASDEDSDDSDDDDSDDGISDNDEKMMLQRQQECIDVIGQIVTTFLQEVSEATGWAFYVLAGGMNKTGEIKIATSSIGKTISGSTFQTNHKNWHGSIVAPWLDFLHLRHPIEERHRCAMIWAEDPSTLGGSTLSVTPSENATTAVPVQIAVPVVSPTISTGAAAPATANNPSLVSLSATMASVPQNDYIRNVNMVNSTNPSVNAAAFNPAFGYQSHVTSQMPLSTTNQLYAWEGANAGKAQTHTLQPFNEPQWTFPSLSTFPSAGTYQSNPATFNYAPAPAMNTNNGDAVSIDSHHSFSPNEPIVDNSTLVPMTTHSTVMTPDLNAVAAITATGTGPTPTSFALGDTIGTTGIDTTPTGFALGDTIGTTGQGFTPLTMAPANGIAAHPANSPLRSAANLVLNTVTNRILTGTIGMENHNQKENTGHGEHRSKKRKSYEEDNTQLILPDGCRRPHKPRRIDENNVASVSKKGSRKVAKKVRNK